MPRTTTPDVWHLWWELEPPHGEPDAPVQLHVLVPPELPWDAATAENLSTSRALCDRIAGGWRYVYTKGKTPTLPWSPSRGPMENALLWLALLTEHALTPQVIRAKDGSAGPRFALGRLLITPGARDFLQREGVDPANLLVRHLTGDWGEVSRHDWGANDRAVRDGERLFSAYAVAGSRVWVITDADRSATTVMLPDEY